MKPNTTSVTPISKALVQEPFEKSFVDTVAADQRWNPAITAVNLSSSPRQRKPLNDIGGAIVNMTSQSSPNIPGGVTLAEPQRSKSRLDEISQAAEGNNFSTNENAAPTSVKANIKADADSLTDSIDKIRRTSNGASASDQRITPSQSDSGLASVLDTEVQQPGSTKKSFQAQFREKYKAIRTIFEDTDRPAGPQPREEHLFRVLADAFMDQDAKAFNKAYAELLRIAYTASAVE